MELKTQIHAKDGEQELHITRQFDLPVELIFKAYVEADIVAQWMGTNVIKLEAKRHGSYQLETTDPKGNKHRFSGTIHDCTPQQKIIRTFEMEGTPFGVQLEIYTFEALSESTSKLSMHVIYESVALRDQVLQLPFKQGINMAHNRIEELLRKQK
ncbi:SRPBCC domain-containing protein [Ferruginibacter sp.]